MRFQPSMIPPEIQTFEALIVWALGILAAAVAVLNKVYTNENGVLESAANMLTWPIRPPASQNTVSQQIDYCIGRVAIAMKNGWQLFNGKQHEHVQETVTDQEFTPPPEWFS
ncbi:MAG: hypothetical protein AAGA60_30110 [Cyanobacteria bacterium P01_E01_bin.42]